MSNYKKIQEESKVDDRNYGQWIAELWSGVSTSRYMGAKKDIPYLTQNAPADLERAKLFDYTPEYGTRAAFYRSLAPDSTVSYQMGFADEYPGYEYGYGGMSMDQLMANNLSDIDMNRLASYLADYRQKQAKK